jgi:hypothetical protein
MIKIIFYKILNWISFDLKLWSVPRHLTGMADVATFGEFCVLHHTGRGRREGRVAADVLVGFQDGRALPVLLIVH